MTLVFNIAYRTQWGENLTVRVRPIDRRGRAGDALEYPLSTRDGEVWEGEIELPASHTGGVEYKYAMWRDGTLVWTEWEAAPHIVRFDGKARRYILQDRWRPIPEELPLFSSAYAECVGPVAAPAETAGSPRTPRLPAASTLQLRVVEPRLRKGEWLAVCGSAPQMGAWTTPMRMTMLDMGEWMLNLDADMLYDEVEYKYVVVTDDNRILRWEEGANRRLRPMRSERGLVRVITDERPALSGRGWKVAGVVIPVFSLRSERSYGAGDFGDLKAMVDWAAKTGMGAIQTLPVNDTMSEGDWRDSYPYNAISIFALHPLYCDLSALPPLHDKVAMERFMMKRQKLNTLPQMDYERVVAIKMDYLRRVFAQEGAETMEGADFKAFFRDNRDWLVPYAAFSHLRDEYGTADFCKWPRMSRYNEREVKTLTARTGKEFNKIALYYYIQYELHLQLKAARDHARAKGVVIKGDVPIGISRHSVEAWHEPHLFNLDTQTGAPPDDFSTNGQNWGFPTYNWEAMAADGYRWWTRRFQKMAEYFDAYRIDHVLGFFRIWEIPSHSVHGLLGQFAPSLPMSVKEIESYGLRFDAERMTRPFITDQTLQDTFGHHAGIVKMLYLKPIEGEAGLYALRPEYDTQRKIQAAFEGKNTEDAIATRDGLYALASCVLFVADRTRAGVYHPRISAQRDHAFAALTPLERDAFNRLYNDYFYHRHNTFWYEEAMRKLPILTQATRMLVCAEDLGMVPDCVPWVMNNLKMLSLEIQTMPKQPALQFGKLWENPYRSVATIATHDMPPLRMWWDEDNTRTQLFYNQALHKDGTAPHPAPGWLCEEIVSAHLFCPSMFTLLSLQDWLSIDERLRCKDPRAERINIPANPRHYWRYRMHLTIEQLMAADGFNAKVRSLIENSQRIQ